MLVDCRAVPIRASSLQRQGAIDHRKPLPPPVLHIHCEFGRDLRLGFAVIQRHEDE